MSDLRKIQQIYEAGYNGVSIDTPLANYSPPQERQTKTSYRRPVPTTSPDKVDRAMGFNPMVTAPVESEENVAGVIKKELALQLIDAEIKEAQKQGMDYCVYSLSKIAAAIRNAK